MSAPAGRHAIAPELRLLPRDALITTGEVDHADWNYRPLLGRLQRARFHLLLSLMEEERYGRLLEIGYGSGVLLPELATRCDELFGVDSHEKAREVAGVLAAHGVRADLRCASVTELPFAAGFFDGAVAVSCLEYVEEIATACRELARVLRPGGKLLVVTPGHGRPLDLALRLVTGSDAAAEYGDRRERLAPALLERFRLIRERRLPRFAGRRTCVYRGLRLESR